MSERDGWIKTSERLPDLKTVGWVLVHWKPEAMDDPLTEEHYHSPVDICTAYYVHNGIGRHLITHWRELPEAPTLANTYDPDYGDDKPCICGHPYHRHFDGYEDNEAVGCKYCDSEECPEFTPPSEEPADAR